MRFLSYILILTLSAAALSGCSKPSGQRELDSGIRELKRENFVRAKALLEKSIARRPGHTDNAMAHNYLGIASWRLGKFSEAMTAFEDSRRLNPNLIEPVYNLGVLAAERDDMKSAARYLNEAATMNRTDPRALEYLAELYMERNQWPQARNSLYSALDREPRSSRIYNSIAAVHVALNQPNEALESLMMALESDTRYAPSLFNLAVLYDTQIGDAEQARAYYKRFISTASRDAKAPQARAAMNRIEEKGTLVTVVPPVTPLNPDEPLIAPGEVSDVEIIPVVQAVVTTTPAVAESPVATTEPESTASTKTPPARDSGYDTLLRQAEDKAKAGQIQQSIDTYVRAAELAANERRTDLQEKAYREAVRVAIDQPRAHALLGQHLYDRGKYDQAERAFRQAATLNGDYAPAQLGLARLAMRKNEYDAALVHFRKVISSDPTLSDAQWEFAQLYDKNLELPENAARAYRDFARNFPNDPRKQAALARAETLSPAPKAVQALPSNSSLPESSASARRLDYRVPTTRNTVAATTSSNRAGVYHEQRDWDRAIYFYLRALENDDQLPGVFYNLGICYTMKGDYDLARDAYRRAIALQPGNVDAKYNLALLYRENDDDATAIRLLNEVVKGKADYATAHYALGLIYSDKPENYAKARQHYEKFLSIAPNDRSAPVIRQWLSAH